MKRRKELIVMEDLRGSAAGEANHKKCINDGFTNLKDSTSEHLPCVLVDGPSWGNMPLYGKWLIAAARANALWYRAINDHSFKKQVSRIIARHIPDFSIGAAVLVARLTESYRTFIVRLDEDDDEWMIEFMMMVEMGFFIRRGEGYDMVVPSRLTIGKVKRAALKLAQTEDEECRLHPERLVTTMAYAEAKAWQACLSGMKDQLCGMGSCRLLP